VLRPSARRDALHARQIAIDIANLQLSPMAFVRRVSSRREARERLSRQGAASAGD